MKKVARVLPMKTTSGELIGCLRGKIRVNGDLMSTGVRWSGDRTIRASRVVPLV